MRQSYSAVLLRYVHDVAAGEFVNVGVVVFSPDAKYLNCLCTQRYGRVSQLFGDGHVNGPHLKGVLRWVQSRIDELGSRLAGELDLGQKPQALTEALVAVLPRDDSSLQWSQEMGGLTANPERTLEELYFRFVERYEHTAARKGREDEDVWRPFKVALQTERVLGHLKPHLIQGSDYEYNFTHAWRNGLWNVYEPISLDLLDAESIKEKGVRWLGRAQSLGDAEEKFKLYALLGAPSDDRLRPAYIKAKNIMHKMDAPHDFVREDEVADLARSLALEIVRSPVPKD
jgi:hypothetical protein